MKIEYMISFLKEATRIFMPDSVVKTGCILCLLCCFSLESNAQNISIKFKNAPFKLVVKELKKQTGYNFLANESLINDAKPVSIEVKSSSLKRVLAMLSEKQDFDLVFSDNTIIIKPKQNLYGSGLKIDSETSKKQTFYPLNGRVTDSKGTPLAGVNAQFLNMRSSPSISDRYGNFQLQVFEGGEILFTMVGFQSSKVKVKSQDHLHVVLQQKENVIEETIVTGYGSRLKETFTGASTTITREQLAKFNNRNVFSIIKNLDPSFNIQESLTEGSNPNHIPEITVRGQTMVVNEEVSAERGKYAVNAPLVIVDGFEVSLAYLYDLDVNRIETITLLKDASATALYGSRGANSVLVIETRLPKEGKLSVTYQVKPSTVVVDLSDYNLMNARQKLQYEVLSGLYDSPYPETRQRNNLLYTAKLRDIEAGVNTDWLYQPVQTTTSLAHSLRLEGGSGQVRYSIDGNYEDNKGAIKQSGRIRSGAGFQLMYRISQRISFSNRASLVSSTGYNSPYGSLSEYALMNPYYKIHDENGELIKVYNQDLATLLGSQGYLEYNPLYNAKLPFRDKNHSVDLSNRMALEIYLTPRLQISGMGLVAKTFSGSERYKSPQHTDYYTQTDNKLKGSYTFSTGEGINYAGQIRLNYGNTLGDHVYNISGSSEISAINGWSTGYSVTGFLDDDFISPAMAQQYAVNSRPSYSNGVRRSFGSLLNGSYSYKRKYNFSGTYRLDGSSVFGNKKRYAGFWSTGVSYNLHHEKFIPKALFSNLRVFANYGLSGMDAFSQRMTSTSYSIGSGNLYYKQVGYKYASEGNPYLQWPKIYSSSAGLEAGLLHGRINLRANLYRRVTTNMVSEIQTAPSAGLAGNQYFFNMGEVVNKGFEGYVNLQVIPTTTKGFSWYINLSGVRNISKLSKISDALKALNARNNGYDQMGRVAQTPYYQEGESLNNIKGVKSLGIDPATGAELYLTLDNQPTFTWSSADIRVLADATPKLMGTFNSSFNFKQLSIEAFFNYTYKKYTYNSTLVSKVENIGVAYNADARILTDRWKQPGDQTFFKAIGDKSRTELSSRFLQEENTLQLSTININYALKRTWLQRFKLQEVKFNCSMNDVVRWSTVRMERGTYYPFARTYNMGVYITY